MTIIGFDLLGLAHPKFEVKGLHKILPKNCAIGAFDDPFGDVIPKLRQMLKTGHYSAVRIQAHWSNSHAIVALNKLKPKLPRYEALAKDFPEVSVYVSHSCEHNEGDKSKVAQRIQMIADMCPSCIPVNSVWRGAEVSKCVTEHHGDIQVENGEIVSTDGINIYDINAAKYMTRNSRALITFVWGYRYNGRQITDPGQVPPSPMDRTAWPSPEYHASLVRLTEPKGKAPDFIEGVKVIPIKDPMLWKTHAEDSQGSFDKRSNKPVLIIPAHAPIVELLTCKGQLVGSLKYGGVYQAGLHRYYSGMSGGINLYGYEIGERAKKISGSEWVWFKCGGKVFGPVHSAFRQGSFR